MGHETYYRNKFNSIAGCKCGGKFLRNMNFPSSVNAEKVTPTDQSTPLLLANIFSWAVLGIAVNKTNQTRSNFVEGNDLTHGFKSGGIKVSYFSWFKGPQIVVPLNTALILLSKCLK